MCSTCVVSADSFLHQGGVELVGVGAKGLVAFQDDHRVAVGIELAEDPTDVLHRLQ